NPSSNTATINTGINHSDLSPSRARSRPLAEPFAPRQLTWTQGKKKQIKTKTAALRLIFRPFILINLQRGAPINYHSFDILGIYLELAAMLFLQMFFRVTILPLNRGMPDKR